LAIMSSNVSEVFTTGKVAVVTGCSSGIGRAAARMCAKAGMKVFMADIDEENLAEAVEEVAGLAACPEDVVGHRTDVSDVASVNELKDAVIEKFGGVHFLMNNAGVGTGGGAFADLKQWERTVGVNSWGVIYGCQAFVPAMIEAGEPGIVVNTGSKQGITMPPGNLAYNVSKAAVKAYTEGLQYELRNSSGRVTSHLLVPGWVNTSIVRKTLRAKALDAGEEFDDAAVPFDESKPADGAWMPDQVIEFMLSEIEKGRFYVLCPDNDVDRETDNVRMAWTMGDLIENRPPLSRWHPDYKDSFTAHLEESRRK